MCCVLFSFVFSHRMSNENGWWWHGMAFRSIPFVPQPHPPHPGSCGGNVCDAKWWWDDDMATDEECVRYMFGCYVGLMGGSGWKEEGAGVICLRQMLFSRQQMLCPLSSWCYTRIMGCVGELNLQSITNCILTDRPAYIVVGAVLIGWRKASIHPRCVSHVCEQMPTKYNNNIINMYFLRAEMKWVSVTGNLCDEIPEHVYR